MSSPTLESVERALREVVDPVFEKPLGVLGTYSDLKVQGTHAFVKISVNTPSREAQQELRRRVQDALTPLGIEFAEVQWDIRVPAREATSEDAMPEVRNIIVVMSGKGGVGKSTVTTNLALALSRAGMRVGILDADIYGPSIPTMLGIAGQPVSKDGQKIQPLQRFGIKLMSVGFLLEDPKQAVVWRGPMLHGALQQFMGDVDWGELDHLLIDMPPGTGDVALTISQKARVTGAVIVTTPQEVALQDVYKSVSMCQKVDMPVLGVVENMSHYVDSSGEKVALFGAGGGVKIAEYAKAPLLGQLPIDPEVGTWGDQGTPITQAKPSSAIAEAFSSIADQLTERIAKAHYDRKPSETAAVGEERKRLRILK